MLRRRNGLGRHDYIRCDLCVGTLAVEARRHVLRAAREVHFWLALISTIIYVFAMWNSGIIQGLMWRTYSEAARSFSFRSVSDAPYYIARAIGGLFFLVGTSSAATISG